MKKQIVTAIAISLFFCLTVFGGENEAAFQAGVNAFDKIAWMIAEDKNKNEGKSEGENQYENQNENENEKNSPAALLQDIQSVTLGESYAGLKEEAKRLAEEEKEQPELPVEEEKKQPKLPGNRWGIFLTPSEIDLLARIVMLEAGGESALGQQAVVEVIFNRMVSPYYGGSLEQVLSARGQFATWKMRYSAQAAPTPQVMTSINAVLQGETNILPLQTLYFSRKPQNRRVQIRIGGHAFCNQ